MVVEVNSGADSGADSGANYPRTNGSPDADWQQGLLVEVMITDLSDRGDGVGRYANRAVFVPETVTGDRVLVRLLRVKPQYAYGQLVQLLHPSSHRTRPSCIVADRCGGCQWQHVDYAYQREAKRQMVVDALQRIGGFDTLNVAPVLAENQTLNYRNKATYPLRESGAGQVNAGYFRKGSHRLVNLNRCPVQDDRLDPLLAEIKHDIQARGWTIYSEKKHSGDLRHMSLRIGRRTGQILLTLVSTHADLTGLGPQAEVWMARYPDLVGVCLNENPKRTNTILGPRTHCVAGQPHIEEEFAGLRFRIGPDTFFQVNTEQAESMLSLIIETLNLQGTERLVDAYCGVGTMALPLSRHVAQVIGLESQSEAVEQAQRNAKLNGIENVEFRVGAVEQVLQTLDGTADIVLMDPPRKGCDRQVIETLRQQRPRRIVYVSCKPSTQARDLKLLCESGEYRLVSVQPVDFFPQTAHVESVAFLELVDPVVAEVQAKSGPEAGPEAGA